MATGDLIVFEEAKAFMIDGGWEPADEIWCAIIDNTVTPTAAGQATPPVLANYTQVGTAGSYVSGGLNLGAISVLVAEAGGTMTFDSATNPTWAQHASNDVDAWWAIVYNTTDTTIGVDPCLAFVELGGPVDMSAGDLTITWNASGLFTLA